MIAYLLLQLIEACKSLLNETGDEVWEEEGSSWITMDTFIVFLVGFSVDNMGILSWATESSPSGLCFSNWGRRELVLYNLNLICYVLARLGPPFLPA